jgi:hypothetical protein
LANDGPGSRHDRRESGRRVLARAGHRVVRVAPHRVGEVAFFPLGERLLVGRGDVEVEKFAQFVRQRPGEVPAVDPLEGILGGPTLSRRQLTDDDDEYGSTRCVASPSSGLRRTDLAARRLWPVVPRAEGRSPCRRLHYSRPALPRTASATRPSWRLLSTTARRGQVSGGSTRCTLASVFASHVATST